MTFFQKLAHGFTLLFSGVENRADASRKIRMRRQTPPHIRIFDTCAANSPRNQSIMA